MGGQHR